MHERTPRPGADGDQVRALLDTLALTRSEDVAAAEEPGMGNAVDAAGHSAGNQCGQGSVMELRDVLSRNDLLVDVLDRAADLALPGWYLAAGCVFQTVWNVVTGRPPAHGIKDYDLIYFDDTDLSWEAEDRVIRAVGEVFGDVPVEVRNEARVHLWYEEKFGVPCPPYTSTEDAIDSFPAIACCLGVRIDGGGEWQVYASHGVDDAFDMVLRPNRVLAPRSVYDAKTARWRREWPELRVVPWD